MQIRLYLDEDINVLVDEYILNGEPIMQGTHTSVRAIAETWRMGVLLEEILQCLPHLTLVQVFDA
ncbi:hypothetical protein NIES4072_68760 [Nostoc commune NIES-4072]|uniref:DUF433 domain-containing protein n=1 Tax=Nostoc commune NIES-4072 TaxID=2005467 RepID=A0A2R5G5Y7_NOSCO|nr:DUF433 domain-containing protein [Nostoc commune]BBD70508.1 hypothetical protein NIES4070_69190 [Nostoc commune HK-02]GBG23164.1 hypothetical protein NIES4072_68760 [Nostoc commune NIES-4072]